MCIAVDICCERPARSATLPEHGVLHSVQCACAAAESDANRLRHTPGYQEGAVGASGHARRGEPTVWDVDERSPYSVEHLERPAWHSSPAPAAAGLQIAVFHTIVKWLVFR